MPDSNIAKVPLRWVVLGYTAIYCVSLGRMLCQFDTYFHLFVSKWKTTIAVESLLPGA